MDLDDLPVGRVLTRREALAVLGASRRPLLPRLLGLRGHDRSRPRPGRAWSGRSSPRALLRRRGAQPLRPPLRSVGRQRAGGRAARADVQRLEGGGNACEPLAGRDRGRLALRCGGVYSDVSEGGFNTVGRKFLRGYQVTGSDGIARFTTIYPGWYRGRAVHIHFKVRSGSSSSSAYEFTSQLFFDDALTDQVYAAAPYRPRASATPATRTTGSSARAGRSWC